jgi:hypothetical protein
MGAVASDWGLVRVGGFKTTALDPFAGPFAGLKFRAFDAPET